METKFLNEHLWPGELGHFFILLSFVASLASMVSYWRSVHIERRDIQNSKSWLILGRGGFIVHTLSVVGIFSTLFYIIANHLFEYHYAWEHSNLELPGKYLLSCFWEGQEGSFMLWTFWHCVLGLIVIKTGRLLEARTMTVIAFVQLCLTTMLLGFYFGNAHLGTTPFTLLRHTMQGAPIFSQANYMSFIKDGNGLNPLLQNYWMVIHPPILFLGFASTLIPFAYCMAALWKGEYKDFVKPVIGWSLFSGMILGTGIMMGGKWAYESLNFGGYWAWDPVENASLVPWLVLVAGLHTVVIYKATGRSLMNTFIMYVLMYLLVWYSTFLTRTGVLGDTSVHAFTGEGKSLYYHLLVVLGLLGILSIGLTVYRRKQLPKIKTEESVTSREFWMFVGSFVLLLSAVQIIITTSTAVWAPWVKSIFHKDFAPPLDPMAHYNNIQVWVAILLTLLSGTVLYLRFKKTDIRKLLRLTVVITTISILLGVLIAYSQNIVTWQYDLMLFAACFSLVSNTYYAASLKGKFIKRGASISHFGFAMVLLGVLLSSYNKEVISLNTVGLNMDFGKKTEIENVKESRENVILFRGTPVAMEKYWVTYLGDSTSTEDPRTFYIVHYISKVGEKVKEDFYLYPDAFINPKGQTGLIANPASKHYLTRDVFTFITQAIDPAKRTDTNKYKTFKLKIGDTAFLDKGYMVYRGISREIANENYNARDGDVAVSMDLPSYDLSGQKGILKPIYYIRDNYQYMIDDTVRDMSIEAKIVKIDPKENIVEIGIKQANPNDDYVVMKAIVFPFINVLWIGVIVMVLGFGISLVNRVRT